MPPTSVTPTPEAMTCQGAGRIVHRPLGNVVAVLTTLQELAPVATSESEVQDLGRITHYCRRSVCGLVLAVPTGRVLRAE